MLLFDYEANYYEQVLQFMVKRGCKIRGKMHKRTNSRQQNNKK